MRVKKEMKFICASALLLTGFHLQAMEVLYFEDFEDEVTSFEINSSAVAGVEEGEGYNQWVINNFYTGGGGTFRCDGLDFQYNVGAFPNQPSEINGSPNSNYLHIARVDALDDGVLSSSYFPAAMAPSLCPQPNEAYTAVMSENISTESYENVTLSFWWSFVGGAEPSDTNAAFGEVFYTIDNDVRWIRIDEPIALYRGESDWVQQTISLPEFANQRRLKFAIRFVNTTHVTGASNTGFGFDDMQITGEFNELIFANSFEAEDL